MGPGRGEGVYEIPVGPVHAGIIEPGHFRFQAMGEEVINLEERLGYIHKGIEKRFEALSLEGWRPLAGRVSGDTTVAHALGYCRAAEALTGCIVPPRALWLRALFLEREASPTIWATSAPSATMPPSPFCSSSSAA